MDLLASSRNSAPSCFGLSAGSAAASASASNIDGGAANAKRKLEHSAAPAAQTIKMPRDTTQRRRGSAAIVAADPCAMKRSFSDGTIRDVNLAAERFGKPAATGSGSCLKSPTVVALSALTKNIISPRASASPRLGAPPRPSFPHAPCAEDDDELDDASSAGDSDDTGAAGAATARKHGQLAPLRLSCPSAAAPTPEDPAAPSPSPPRSFRLGAAGVGSGGGGSTTGPKALGAASLAIDMDLDLAPPAGDDSDRAPSASAATAPKRAASTWQAAKKNRNPGNLSLDLSQMEQPAFEPSGEGSGGSSARRSDAAAVCSRVTDFLFVGGAAAAKDRDALLQTGITHIINCAASVAPDFFPNDFLYYNIRLRDHSSQDIARHFYTVFDFIEKARRRGGRVFVHCVKGISRSPTMAIAYLMWYKRIGMYKALDFIRQARPVVDPNAGFIFQLTEWEHLHREGRLKLERTVVFRVEVPRESGGNGNGSRAAEKPLLIGPLTAVGEDTFHNPSKEIAKLSFIVSCADYMVVWCGAEASDLQLEASQHATTLLQAFEAFPDKYEVVYHGQESSSFWSLVGALRPDES